MDGIISIANGSSSSLYGCIGCAVKDMIISKFPDNYFKYTAVSSELATRNIRRTFGGNNSKVEIAKRLKPYLIVQPTYSAMDRDGPLQGIPLTSNFDDLQYRTDKRYLFEVIRDKKYGYNLKFKLNRDRIEFDITVTTSTLHQQIDIYRTMLNQIVWERSSAFRIALESVIPKKMIAIMSKYCNMDIEQNEEYIPILLKRLNACSGYPITYKLRNASATDEWFMYYTHNVIVTFSDLTLESGNKKNMVDDSYNITFRVTAEFNLPGVFMIDGNLDQLTGVDITLKTKEYQEENDSYFPLYTVRNLSSRFPSELNGMQLYGSTIFQTTGKANQLEDRVDIKCVLDSDHMRVIRAHHAWNMDPDTLLNFFILKDNELLTSGTDYTIDWNTLEIVVKTIDNSATYRLLMYFNYETVNEILNNTAYNRNYDIDTLSKNKFPETGIEEDVFFVHDQVTDKDKKSENFFDVDKVPEDMVGEDEVYEMLEDPTYCATDEHGNLDDPDLILFKNLVIINNDADRFREVSKTLFHEDSKPDVKYEIYILQEDDTYCVDDYHPYIDPDLIIEKGVVIIRNKDGTFRQRLSDFYLNGEVPYHEADNPNLFILMDDSTYCLEDNEHVYVDPESILDKNAIILINELDGFKQRLDNFYLNGTVPESILNNPNIIVLEDDPTYCTEEDHHMIEEVAFSMEDDQGIDIMSISIGDVEVPASNADIHNSSVSKKKFSSSI